MRRNGSRLTEDGHRVTPFWPRAILRPASDFFFGPRGPAGKHLDLLPHELENQSIHVQSLGEGASRTGQVSSKPSMVLASLLSIPLN